MNRKDNKKNLYKSYGKKRSYNKKTYKNSSKKSKSNKRRRKANIRKLSLSIFVILLLSIGIYSFKNTSQELLYLESGFNLFSNNKKGTTIDEGVGIEFEENTNFKKYTISFDKEFEKLQSEKGDTFTLKLDKVQLKNLKLKDDELYTYKDFNIQNTNNETSITINTEFSNNNYVFEDELDKNKIEILVSKKKNPYNHKITIDPGHGGDDPGVNPSELTKQNGVKDEKIYTLDISLKTEKYLRYNGINVKYTRTNDVVPGVQDESADLARRASLANKFNSKLLVSIHIDSFVQDTNVSGITAMIDNRDTGYKEESKKLADILKANLLKEDSWGEREIREEPLQVLNESKMPAVLVECGFLTSLEDVKKLNDPQVIENLSKNISNGIIEYLKDKTTESK